jgi:hypothetical protein
MKTKLLWLFILLSEFSIANPIDSTLAKIVGKNFYSQLPSVSNRITKKAIIPLISNTYKSITNINNETDVFYVIGMGTGEGYVIVSADNDVIPVLAYSINGKYEDGNHSEAYLDWMNRYVEYILYVKNEKITADKPIKQKWQALLNNQPSLKNALISVSPLLRTQWDQGVGYNDFCPYNLFTGRTPTGCTATAMAQIMKYWGDKIGHSTQGIGNLTYNCPFYGSQSADFVNTTYNWANMPLDEGNPEVAKLMYHCGVSVKMDYGFSGSGAWVISNGYLSNPPYCAEYAYKTFFGFDASTIQGIDKDESKISDAAWISTIKNELSNGRPVQYVGIESKGGHTWVCDGYDTKDYFHMNWGWGGIDDAYYYSLTNLNTALGGSDKGIFLNSGQQILIGIKPALYTTCTDQFESNNSSATATNVFALPLNDGSSDYPLQANIGDAGDQDWYKINIGYPGTLTVNLTNLPFNYDLELYGPNGLNQFISGSYKTGNTSEQVSYQYSGNSTTVYAKVYANKSSDFSTTSCYQLEFIWTPTRSCALDGITPVLSAPGTNSTPEQTVTTASPTLTWNVVPGATHYDVYIKDLNTNNLVLRRSNATTSTSYTVPAGLLSNNGKYSWNIQANINGGTCRSNYSPALNFQIQTSANLNNDEPCDAELLNVQSICNYETKTIIGATKSTQIPDASCDQPSNVDVWFKFTIPNGKFGIHTNSISISGNDCGLAIYTGSCSSMTERYCTKGGNPSQSYMPWDDNIDLSSYAGQTGYIRIWEFGTVSQTGDFQLCIVGANTNNNCIITSISESTIIKNAASFTTTPGSDDIYFDAQANCSFTVTNNCSWLTVNPMSGTTNSVKQGYINYSIQENKSTTDRQCTFYVNDSPIIIIQRGVPQAESCIYSLSQTSQNFSYSGGNGSFTINATENAGCNWDVSLSPTSQYDLANITSISNGTGTYTVTYNIDPNQTNHSLSSTLRITGNSGFSQDYLITQDANTTCDPTLSATMANFTSNGGSGLFNINIGSNCVWNAYNTCSEMLTDINPISGVGPATITYNVVPNPTSSSRNCNITIQGFNKSHVIKQEGLSTDYTITTSSSTAEGGTTSGGGTYHNGQSCTVAAIANNGYAFSNWSENGSPVSTNSSYTFTLSGNRTLVANFTLNTGCSAPSASVNSPSGASPLTMTCTATGGSGGTIAYKWYSGTSCSGTIIGTSSTLSVSTSGAYSCNAYITGNETTCSNCATGNANVGNLTCTNWTVSPNTQSVPSTGGNYQASVSASGSCSYSLTFNDSWIQIINHPSSGIFAYSVDANTTCSTRTGTISVNNATDGINNIVTLTITQDGSLILGSIAGNTSVCKGGSETYVASPISGATSFIWTLPTGATGTSATNSITVNYGTTAVSGNITVTGHNSCGDGVASTLAIIVNSKPATPVVTLNSNILHSNASTGNQWYNQNVLIDGATNQDYTFTAIGNYSVIVTLDGCPSEPSTVNVITGIGPNEANPSIKVYPNPITDELNIEFVGNNVKTEFVIVNVKGQVVYSGNLFEKVVIQTSNFSDGLYFLKLKSGKTIEFKKIVKL